MVFLGGGFEGAGSRHDRVQGLQIHKYAIIGNREPLRTMAIAVFPWFAWFTNLQNWSVGRFFARNAAHFVPRTLSRKFLRQTGDFFLSNLLSQPFPFGHSHSPLAGACLADRFLEIDATRYTFPAIQMPPPLPPRSLQPPIGRMLVISPPHSGHRLSLASSFMALVD